MKRDRLAEGSVEPRRKAPFIVTRRPVRRQHLFSMLRSVVFQTGFFWSGASDSERFTSASFAASAPIATNDRASSRTPQIPPLIPGSLAQQMAVLLVSSFAAAEPRKQAGVAQLVEQLICNHQVGGSSPFTGSNTNPVDTICYG